ncbi:MAG: aminomethyltransferase beta-barrel domain-containing protein, partial [Rhodoferax sp.]
FVARKDMAHNTLWVVQGHDHPLLSSSSLVADDASWVAGAAPVTGDGAPRLAAKTRYRQLDAACTLRSVAEMGDADAGPEPGRGGSRAFALDFSAAQWAVTPGQSAVLYDGEVCVGGGVIARAGNL